MKKLLRITIGSLIILIGIGVVVFAVPLILPPDNWVSVGAFVVIFAFGGLVTLSGINVLRGERLVDVLRDFFTNPSI